VFSCDSMFRLHEGAYCFCLQIELSAGVSCVASFPSKPFRNPETLLQKEERRRRRAEFHRQFLGPGDLAFDVGASTGNRTELFLEAGARVVCVEPMDACIQVLRGKLGGNRNVVLVQKGVDAREGERTIFYSEEALTTASMSPDWIEAARNTERLRHPSIHWNQSKTVPVTTLDLLIEEFGEPRFCKIDVEGFELEALRGLSRPVRSLSIEYTPERIGPAVECVRYLDSLGRYGFNYVEGESFLFGLDSWVGAREMADLAATLGGRTVHGDVFARRAG